MTTTTNPLLMRCSLAELRTRLLAENSPLAPWWQHFLRLARVQGDWFSPYTVLAALVTDDEADRQRARAAIMRLVELAPEALGSNEAQYHTHVTAAPLGRWAIFYDWLADTGLFTSDEDEAIRAALLDHAFVFPLQGLAGRIRSFDNQILSNAFCATAVGYVCGIKRGPSALGRRLFSNGSGWLIELLKRTPQGGYSGEGSTYQEHVVLPTITLAALLLEETCGLDAMGKGIAPGAPVLQVLQFTHNLIGPAGLLPGWDDHGFMAATVKGPLAYLARATQQPLPLATIRATDMWSRTALPAWEADDRLWTLVWWPHELDNGQAERRFEPWTQPCACGALQHTANKLRLFQYWDICGGLLQAGRLQTDPNAITLEAYGSPLLVDGYGHLPPELSPLPVAARDYVGTRMLETVKEYRGPFMSDEAALGLALGGSVAATNALVFDNETWFVPREECRGHGEPLRQVGALQMVSADAAPFYAERYHANSVTRTSVLVGGEYVMVTDLVDCSEAHSLTWQAFVRADARLQDDRVIVETPEQVRCDLVPLQAGRTSLSPAPDYPTAAVGGSVRLQHSAAAPASARTRLDVALLPQPLTELCADLSEGWRCDAMPEIPALSLRDAYLHDPATHRQQARQFERSFYWKESPARHFISVHQAAPGLQLRLNGHDIAPLFAQAKGIWTESAAFLPHWFDISDALRAGSNDLQLVAPAFRGESLLGPLQLRTSRTPQEVFATRTGADSFSVRRGEARDEIVCERRAAGPWLTGTTDARCALLQSDGALSALQVTELQLPGQLTLSCRPACDIAVADGMVSLSEPAVGTSVHVQWPAGWLRLDIGGALEISYGGSEPRAAMVPQGHNGPIFVNGQLIDRPGITEGEPLRIDLPAAATPAAATPAAATSAFPQPAIAAGTCHNAEQLYALDAAADATSAILQALQSSDWRLQVAACDLAARRGLTEATPLLLQLFAEAGSSWPYRPLQHWWRFSKMLMAAKADGYDADLPPAAINRWRTRRAAATALGVLGDIRAVAVLEEALASCHDFFPVTSQLAVALGRLGSPGSIAVLQRHINHAEVNTRVHSRLALQLLEGEIDRSRFESAVGLL